MTHPPPPPFDNPTSCPPGISGWEDEEGGGRGRGRLIVWSADSTYRNGCWERKHVPLRRGLGYCVCVCVCDRGGIIVLPVTPEECGLRFQPCESPPSHLPSPCGYCFIPHSFPPQRLEFPSLCGFGRGGSGSQGRD